MWVSLLYSNESLQQLVHLSVIALDETILLNFKQQPIWLPQNSFYVLLGVITGFMSIYYTRNF
jgi:CIC family chloride channel protein